MLREDHYGMYLIPLSTPQKFGAIIFGLLAGACTAVGISAMGSVVGFVIALAGIRGWLNLGESGALAAAGRPGVRASRGDRSWCSRFLEDLAISFARCDDRVSCSVLGTRNSVLLTHLRSYHSCA